MNYYEKWIKETSTNNIQEKIVAFLHSYPETIEAFLSTNKSEMEFAYLALNETSLTVFLDTLRRIDKYPVLTTKDVLCFSKLENGVSRLNELLEFSPEGLTFAELGAQLVGSAKLPAQIKYGENHSKLAAALNLVEISNTRPAIVKSTPWGSYLTNFSLSEKESVIKKLLLRNACVQSVIGKALNGEVAFNDLALFLASSTRIRRMSNVRTLVTYILSGSDYETALKNINWDIRSE